jgi:hypothetical protein
VVAAKRAIRKGEWFSISESEEAMTVFPKVTKGGVQKVSPAATSQNLPKPLVNSQQLVKVGGGNLFETRTDDFFDRAKASRGLVRPSNPSRVDNPHESGR